MKKVEITIRTALISDVDTLVELEACCFSSDRLSRRSFRHHVNAKHSELAVALDSHTHQLLGYALTFLHRGTRLARLYSLAVHPEARGRGIAQQLLQHQESVACDHGRLFMRLEVAKNNASAIKLYEASGYRIFGEYCDYYEDHSDALRMQKQIHHVPTSAISRYTPWYQQTTEFTCGPASLMMAMASLNKTSRCTQPLELDIWREATTIFMTSGHGGCHPFGLALAAKRRGFDASVWVNTNQALFVEGVRTDNKKRVMALVHGQLLEQCAEKGVSINYSAITQQQVEQWITRGWALLVLISTYRMDGKKTPHWVVITGVDEHCFYVHDPDLDEQHQHAIDCQHIPIARADFEKMCSFGANRLRSAVAIKAKTERSLPAP